jgi:hypothetical protein
MDHIRKEIRRALLVCMPYFVIVFFQNDLDKFLYDIHSRFGHPLLVLYLFIATVIIFALFIHTVIDLRENYKASGYRAVILVMIYLLTMINFFWSPVRISSEVFHSKIVYNASRREKYGHDLMKLRENGSMEIFYPGQFWMADWEYGKWHKKGDTFYLNYEKARNASDPKPDTLIVSDGLLTPVGIPTDTLNLYKNLFFRMYASRKK